MTRKEEDDGREFSDTPINFDESEKRVLLPSPLAGERPWVRGNPKKTRSFAKHHLPPRLRASA